MGYLPAWKRKGERAPWWTLDGDGGPIRLGDGVVTHSMKRLRKRYGVAIDFDQLERINRILADPRARTDSTVLRRALPHQYHLRGRNSGSLEVWWINLETVVGRPVWAKVLFRPGIGLVMTFLPREAPRDSVRAAERAG